MKMIPIILTERSINLALGYLSNMKISLSLPPALLPSLTPNTHHTLPLFFQWSKNTATHCNNLAILHMQWDCWQILPDGTTREDLLTKFSISTNTGSKQILFTSSLISPQEIFCKYKRILGISSDKKSLSIFVACQILQLDLMQYLKIIYAKAVLYFDFWCFILAEYGSDLWKVLSRVEVATIKYRFI